MYGPGSVAALSSPVTCSMLSFVVKLPESKSRAMLARLMIGEGGAKSLLGSAYSVHCVVVTRLAQDQQRIVAFYFQASVSLDEFCASFDGVRPLLISLHSLKRTLYYLPE